MKRQKIKKKVLISLLTICMSSSSLLVASGNSLADGVAETKQDKSIKPTEKTEQNESVKQTEETEQAEEIKPTEKTEQAEEIKPTEKTEQAEEIKPTEKTEQDTSIKPAVTKERKGSSTVNEENKEASPISGEKGLLGYYFKSANLKDVLVMMNQLTGNLSDVPEDVLQGKKILSAKFEGRIKVKQSGEYAFRTSSDKYTKMDINDTEINSGQKITLEKDRFYRIEIKYQNNDQAAQPFDLKLMWTTPNRQQEEVIPAGHLFAPELKPIENSKSNDRSSNLKSNRLPASLTNEDRRLDSDGDKILNELEIKGYTIEPRDRARIIVPWNDRVHKDQTDDNGNKYIKYVSDPSRASTARDPYSDYAKVTGVGMDPAVQPEDRHPLLAAYPIVRAKLEQFVLSKREDISIEEGKTRSDSISGSVSTGHTDTFSVSTSVEADFSVSGGVKVTGSFGYDRANTASVEKGSSQETGTSWAKTIGLNTGEAAYLGVAVRYVNRGIAPIYNVKPTATLLLGEQSITTLTMNKNQQADLIKPGATYPIANQRPLHFDSKDEENESHISLNREQVDTLERTGKLSLETNQTNGLVGEVDKNDHVQPGKNTWTGFISTIEETSVLLGVEQGSGDKREVIERRIAAKDQRVFAEQSKPEVTLEEALQIAYRRHVTEEKGSLKWNGENIDEKFEFVLDEATAKEFESQLKQITAEDQTIDSKKLFYKCKLRAGMKILIREKRTISNVPLSATFELDNKGKVKSIVASVYQNNDSVTKVAARVKLQRGAETSISLEQDRTDATKWRATVNNRRLDLTYASQIIATTKGKKEQVASISIPQGVTNDGLTFVSTDDYPIYSAANLKNLKKQYPDAKTFVVNLYSEQSGKEVSYHLGTARGRRYDVHLGATDNPVLPQNVKDLYFSFYYWWGWFPEYTPSRNMSSKLRLLKYESLDFFENRIDSVTKDADNPSVGIVFFADKQDFKKGKPLRGRVLGIKQQGNTDLFQYGMGDDAESALVVNGWGDVNGWGEYTVPNQTSVTVIPADIVPANDDVYGLVQGYFSDNSDLGSKFNFYTEGPGKTEIDLSKNRIGRATLDTNIPDASGYVVKVTSRKISSDKIDVSINQKTPKTPARGLEVNRVSLGSRDSHGLGLAAGAVFYNKEKEQDEVHSPTRSETTFVPANPDDPSRLDIHVEVGTWNRLSSESKVEVEVIGYYSKSAKLVYKSIDPIALGGIPTNRAQDTSASTSITGANKAKFTEEPEGYLVQVTAENAGSDVMEFELNGQTANFATSPTSDFNGKDPVGVTRDTLMIVRASGKTSGDPYILRMNSKINQNWNNSGNYRVKILGYFHS